MPRLDDCHEQVVRALQKDGWVVRDKPLRIRTNLRAVHIDIEATRNTNGSSQHILLAEIKCFPDRKSTTAELYIAVGQYVIYRAILAEANMAIPLYLAVPEIIYNTIFDSTVRGAISDNNIKMIIVNLETETITQWIE